MNQNIENQVKNIFSAVFEISSDEINDKSSPDTIASWDSLKHMNLVIALEEEFNVQFDIEDIPQLILLPEIIRILKQLISNGDID